MFELCVCQMGLWGFQTLSENVFLSPQAWEACDKGRMQQESEKTSTLGEAQRTAPPSFPSMHSLSARGFVLICKDS